MERQKKDRPRDSPRESERRGGGRGERVGMSHGQTRLTSRGRVYREVRGPSKQRQGRERESTLGRNREREEEGGGKRKIESDMLRE